MLVIHDLVVYLVSGGNFLDNRDTDKPMSSLWASVGSLRCCSVMYFLSP